MGQVQGSIEVVSEKVATNGKTIHSFAINKTWYSTYDKKMVDKGDYVTFEFKQNGNFNNVDNKTVTKGESKVQDNSQSSSPVANLAPAPRNDTQATISFNAANNTAIQFLDMALRNEVIKLGGKAGDKLLLLEEMHDKIALRFYRSFRAAGSISLVEEVVMEEVKTTEDDDEGFE